MTKIKEKLKKSWLYSVYIIIGIFMAVIGWLLGGKATMLNATTFNGSNVTYNENQILNNITSEFGISTERNITIGYNNPQNRYMITSFEYVSSFNGYTTYIHTNCTLSSNVLTCTNRYQVQASSSSSIPTGSNTTTWTINSNTVVDNNSRTYTIVQTGYTEQQYLAYGTQQYNSGYSAGISYVQAHPAEYNLYTSAQYSANYTAGQNSVINSPNTYGLYTQAQYEANYTSGYNAGVLYVQNHPSEYNLYTSAQYTAYGSSQYTAGQNSVLNSPNTYNLYTSAQYNSYGTTQFSAGENAVQNDPHTYGLYTSNDMTNNYNTGVQYVLDHPNEYNLYTSAQYNANAQEQYNIGYLAGQQASTNYQDGIQYVLDHPAEYNLYTTAQYTAYGTSQYIAGQNSILNDPNTYNLYNQTQYDTHGQEQYNIGYSDGVDSFESAETVLPTFNILNQNLIYGCVNGNNYHDVCTGTNVPGNDVELSTLKLSTYAPYTNVLFNVDYYGNNYAYNIDTYNYMVIFSKLYSANGTIGIPNSVSDVYIKFCNSVGEYYILSERYTYCNSIATNVENYTPSGEWLGISSLYDNPGIYVGNITDVEDNYKIINLSNYLVGNLNNYQWIQITLGNANDIQTQYTNFEIKYISSSLDSEAYNLGYENGFSKGNALGLATRQQADYNRGYNTGYREATQVGDNSIRGLAETILTSPVNMFKTMFNVQFLDINLAEFILSIFTILVVIWLIKKLW